MKYEVDATYENGVLVLAHPVPLVPRQAVKVTIETESPKSATEAGYGILDWKGDPDIVRLAALDPSKGFEESP